MGDIEADDLRVRQVATEVAAVVVSVGYSLAPEHPFPAAPEDCYGALRWLADSASALDVDAARIAVCGVSAGANLAAAVALIVRERAGPRLALQLLNYPVLDDRTRFVRRPEEQPLLWSRQNNEDAWRIYLGNAINDDAPSHIAAPARARELSELPPAYITTAELDLLCAEGIDYARRLLDAGVSTELHVYPRTFHAFDSFVPQAEISKRCCSDWSGALKRALYP